MKNNCALLIYLLLKGGDLNLLEDFCCDFDKGSHCGKDNNGRGKNTDFDRCCNHLNKDCHCKKPPKHKECDWCDNGCKCGNKRCDCFDKDCKDYNKHCCDDNCDWNYPRRIRSGRC